METKELQSSSHGQTLIALAFSIGNCDTFIVSWIPLFVAQALGRKASKITFHADRNCMLDNRILACREVKHIKNKQNEKDMFGQQ